MKLYHIIFPILLVTSCNYGRHNPSDIIMNTNDTINTHDVIIIDSCTQKIEGIENKKEEKKREIVEAIRLCELIPKRQIINELIDNSINILRKNTRQKYLLNDYGQNKFDCYTMSLCTSNYGDTIFSIIPGWLCYQVFVSNYYLGYYTRKGYPFIISGDAASCFFRAGKRGKTFYSGTVPADERIISIPIFVVNENNYWQIN